MQLVAMAAGLAIGALIPRNPAAPIKANGRQQATLENAASMAATGVARSTTRIASLPPLCL